MSFFTPASNVVLRSFMGFLMISVFIKISTLDKTWLVILSCILTTSISYEIINITSGSENTFSLNTFLVASISISIFLANTVSTIAVAYPKTRLLQRLYFIKPVIFGIYSISLMFSILSFEKEILDQQLLLLTVVHVATYICSLACAMSIKNTTVSKFFYVYPALLVISNDIFAYIIGKLIGKSHLIVVSPNKTVEGFIGGFVCSFLVGIIISYLKINGKFLPDGIDYIFSRPLSPKKWYLNIPSIYVHNILFVIAASFLAPFSGFVTSAVKRVFGKKDFGSIILGHGGFTDRFDCQILMVFFTYYYLKMFGNMDENNTSEIYHALVDNLKNEELQELSEKLLKTTY